MSLDMSTKSRIEAASQGYLSSFDDVQRGWALVALLCVAAIFLTGYLLMRRSQRQKAENERKLRLQEKQGMRHIGKKQ